MTQHPSRFQQIESHFLELAALSPADRKTKLQSISIDDPDLAQELTALLDIDESNTPLLSAPSINITPTSPAPLPIPHIIPNYTITQTLGHGGMGIVYEALQINTNRKVALKLIKDPNLNPSHLQTLITRFKREATILAKLNHPGIATIYESGTTTDPTPSPYVAMELILGQPITTFATSNTLSTTQRVELITKVAQALACAHDNGIIHRDLKPSNILVTDNAQPKILDFGIALELNPNHTQHQVTQTGQLLGTLQYMAPEQIDQSTTTSTTQTDVYALGLIAFELLTGSHAHATHNSSMYDLVRSIRDDEPETLSAHNPTLKGDLDTIIAKALSKDPARRYNNASELADDLTRYLNHQPINARPPTTWYQLRKFSQRNPLLVSSVATIILVLTIAVILISNALRIANQERAIAKQEQHAQQLTALFVTEDLFAAGNPDFNGDANISLLDAMRQASDAIPERFKDAPDAEASISFTIGDQFRLMNDFDKAETHLTRAVELSKQLPDLHPDILLNRINSLVDLYNDIDNLDAALENIEFARSYIESTPQVSPQIEIDTLVQHASIMYYKRDMDASAQIFKQAVDLGEQTDPLHHGTVDAATALAMVYTNLKRYDEARPMHQRGIELRTQSLGESHPATLQAMDNYAIQLFRDGDLTEAHALLTKVLNIRLEVFGPDHHKTDLTRALIGRTHILAEEYDLAEPILLDAHQGLTQTLGKDHRYTLVAQKLLHDLYTKSNRPDQAKPYELPTPTTTP